MPGAEIALERRPLAMLEQRHQRIGEHADVAPADAFDLVDLGGVDVDVRDALGVPGKLERHARHTIVEARAERDEEITIVHGIVGERRAVHTEHPHRKRFGGIECADAHQRRHHREAESAGELAQAISRTAVDDAAAGVDERALRFAEHAEEIGTRSIGERAARELVHALAKAGNRQPPRALEDTLPVLHILRHVEHHRAGPAGARDLECGAHRRLEPRGIGDQEHMFRDRAHDARHRRFLKRIRADRRGGHLAADHHHRHGVRHRIAHRRHGVGGSGSRRDHAHADLAARARVARGHEARALLVRRHDQGNAARSTTGVLLVVDEHRIVSRQDRAARVAEDRVDAFVRQHLDDHFGAGERAPGERMGAEPVDLVLFFHCGCARRRKLLRSRTA